MWNSKEQKLKHILVKRHVFFYSFFVFCLKNTETSRKLETDISEDITSLKYEKKKQNRKKKMNNFWLLGPPKTFLTLKNFIFDFVFEFCF
jgi:hypothetical protein